MMSPPEKEKKKTIIGKRVRVGVGDDVRFEDKDNVKVLGEDTTIIVSTGEAKTLDRIVGEEVIVQVGDFNPITRQIDENENIDADTKEELKAKVKELEEELRGRRDKSKIRATFNYFKDNAPWLVPAITEMLKILTKKGM